MRSASELLYDRCQDVRRTVLHCHKNKIMHRAWREAVEDLPREFVENNLDALQKAYTDAEAEIVSQLANNQK